MLSAGLVARVQAVRVCMEDRLISGQMRQPLMSCEPQMILQCPGAVYGLVMPARNWPCSLERSCLQCNTAVVRATCFLLASQTFWKFRRTYAALPARTGAVHPAISVR